MPRTYDAELHITQLRYKIGRMLEDRMNDYLSSGTLTKKQSDALEELYTTTFNSIDSLRLALKSAYKKDKEGNETEISRSKMELMRERYFYAFRCLGDLLTDGKLQEDEYKLVQSALDEIGTEMNILQRVSNANKYNIPEIFRNNSEKVITLSNEVYSTVGGAQSSRIPVNYVDGNNVVVNGYFTPEKKLDANEEFPNLIADIRKSMGLDGFADSLNDFWIEYNRVKRAEYIEGLKKKYKSEEEREKLADKYMENIMKVLSDELFSFDIQNIPKYFIGKDHPLSDAERKAFAKQYKLTDNVDSFGFRLEVLYKKYIDKDRKLNSTASEKDASSYFQQYTPQIHKAFNQSDFYIEALGCKNGCNIDKRNTAMSDVAKLLGVPDLICHSENMTLIINGEPVRGTFMRDAKGIDINRRPANFKGFLTKQEDSSSLASIFDLQVLDYICGNIDRHGGNMFYQYDDNGKLTGVQGIDNDCSFGTDSFRGYYTVQRLSCPEKMNYITPSMKAAVSNLTPEALKAALAGKDLDQSEINAAVERLDYLKKSLKSLKVFDDKCLLYKTPLSDVTLSSKFFPQGTSEITTLAEFLNSAKEIERGKRYFPRNQKAKNRGILSGLDNNHINENRLSQINNIASGIDKALNNNNYDYSNDRVLYSFFKDLDGLGIAAHEAVENGLSMTNVSTMKLQYSKLRNGISKIRRDHAADSEKYPEELINELKNADAIFESQSKLLSDAIPELNNRAADSVRENVKALKKAAVKIEELKKTGMTEDPFKSVEDILYEKDNNGEPVYEIQRDENNNPVYRYGMKKVTEEDIAKEHIRFEDIVFKDDQAYAKVYFTKTVDGNKVRIPKLALENGKPIPVFKVFTDTDRKALGAFITEMPDLLGSIESKDDPRLSYGMSLLKDALKAVSKQGIKPEELNIDAKAINSAKTAVKDAEAFIKSSKKQHDMPALEDEIVLPADKEIKNKLPERGKIKYDY